MEEMGEIKINRVGYKFLGWRTYNKKGENSIYPIWQANEYHAFFDSEGRSIAKYQKVKYQDFIREPEIPNKLGKKFIGWSQQSDKNGKIWNFKRNRMPAEDVTLYAIFESIEAIMADDFFVFLDEVEALDKETIIEKANVVAKNIEISQLIDIETIDFSSVKIENGIYPILLKTMNGKEKEIFLKVIYRPEKEIIKQNEIVNSKINEYCDANKNSGNIESIILPPANPFIRRKYIVQFSAAICALVGASFYYLNKKK